VSPELQTVALAAGTAAVVGAAGALLVVVTARRSIRAASVVTPLVVVASVAVGVLVSARAMFLSSHDLTAVLLVLAATTPVALGFGVVLARRVRVLDRRAADEAAARVRDREVEASRREMVAWVSHDLRSPLAGIRAMAESLEDGVVDEPGRYHARIRVEADRMAAMVDDLLMLSRIQAGALHLARDQVDVADLVSDAIASVKPVADEAGVHLQGSADGLVTVEVDAGQVSRALTNLVVNAVRHTPPDGTVALAARQERDSAVLTVRDHCGGIPDGDLAKLFEPGWRGSDARTPGRAGAGLGLAIVQGVVEAHGGRVGVANVPGGCRFEVRLPVARRPRQGSVMR
jgi:signal transduction histidine kinase